MAVGRAEAPWVSLEPAAASRTHTCSASLQCIFNRYASALDWWSLCGNCLDARGVSRNHSLCFRRGPTGFGSSAFPVSLAVAYSSRRSRHCPKRPRTPACSAGLGRRNCSPRIRPTQLAHAFGRIGCGGSCPCNCLPAFYGSSGTARHRRSGPSPWWNRCSVDAEYSRALMEKPALHPHHSGRNDLGCQWIGTGLIPWAITVGYGTRCNLGWLPDPLLWSRDHSPLGEDLPRKHASERT